MLLDKNLIRSSWSTTIIDSSLHMSCIMRKPVYAICNNKGSDQLAHPCSLSSTFVVRYLDSIIPILAKSRVSRDEAQSRKRLRGRGDSNNKRVKMSHVTKPTKWHVRQAKTQTSLGIRPVWSESSLYAQWVAAKDPSFSHADSENSYQTGRMLVLSKYLKKSKTISNDQELIQSDPTSCPQNQKENN